jgi:heme/copper-type cytochrome/quinol oxidase subunit 1
MPALVGGFGNYFLPIHLGAPDYFNYLNCFVLFLLNTLKKAKAHLLFIFKGINL